MSDKILKLTDVAQCTHGVLHGNEIEFFSVSTDSRHITPGQLFVALRGPSFDGHDYVEVARGKGAIAAVVEHRVDVDLPQIVVTDTRIALGQLAACWRDRFDIPVIAVTGSNGKTTVKEMIAAILMQNGNVHATRGNLNNEIGVPLTLLGLNEQHTAAVIEEGASQPGDIAYLTRLVRPTVSIITNVSGAHLEGFGSLESVARTKGEIYEFLQPGGTAVINNDDAYAAMWREACGENPIVSFGMDKPADVSARWKADQALTIQTPQGEIPVRLLVAGRHNAMNALAATAAALAAGAGLDEIRTGLESMQPVAGRLQWKTGINHCRVLDDTYNANPASLNAALDVLAACKGERFLALGDMAELGEDAASLHEQAGKQARACGVDQLYGVGEFTRYAVAAFGEQGHHFPAQEEMIRRLRKDLHENVTLLVKGSRSSHMEKVVEAVESRGAA